MKGADYHLLNSKLKSNAEILDHLTTIYKQPLLDPHDDRTRVSEEMEKKEVTSIVYEQLDDDEHQGNASLSSQAQPQANVPLPSQVRSQGDAPLSSQAQPQGDIPQPNADQMELPLPQQSLEEQVRAMERLIYPDESDNESEFPGFEDWDVSDDNARNKLTQHLEDKEQNSDDQE